MSRRDNRGDWSVVAAIGLIALGAWFLLGNIFGDAWQEAIRRAFSIAWPVALIGLGILLLLSTSRGSSGATGQRLRRSRDDRMVGGVLAGVAEYFGTDPTIIRVLYAIFGVLTGVWPAVVVYVIAMIVIPEAPKGGDPQQVDWPQTGQAPPPTPPASGGWPHTGTETVQTPVPEPPAAPAPAAPAPAPAP